MHAAVTRTALVVGVGVLSVAGYHLAAKASPAESFDHQELVSSLGDFPASYGSGTSQHELTRLRLLKRTMHFVDEKYVDPGRIDPNAMFDAALDRVERQVSEVLFQRSDDGQLLHISVGSYTTTLELPPIDSTGDLQDQLSRVAEVLDAHLSAEIDPAEVEYALINGVLGTLDPHSILLPPADAQDMDVDNAGEFGGLGITITTAGGVLTVEYPLEDTPAWDAGLKAEDRIIRINGESTVNMDIEEAVSRLRGKVGSVVTITVERDTWEQPRDIDIERATISLRPVKGALLEGDIGYVRITNFSATVSTDLKDQISGFKREANRGELQGLVLDLRGNPGGYLHQAIEVSDLFLKDGTIVATVEREGSKVDETTARAGTTIGADLPIVVLVDAGSASASEIVAGALKNRGRAVVVGERTFGKGSVQHLYPNEADGSKLKLTVARYLTPGDKSIQAIGIPPDIALEQAIFYELEGDETTPGVTLVSMHGREHALREADLDHSLEHGDLGEQPPAYTVQWLNQLDDSVERPRSDKVDVSGDWQVQFARELLLASPDGANRAQILSSVDGVVSSHAKQEQQRIAEAFGVLGVDWTVGDNPESPNLSASLDLGPDGLLLAGEDNEEMVQLQVTNSGDATLYQVMAMCESGVSALASPGEFYFGKLEPGQSATYPTLVRLDEGYQDSVGQLSCTWRDGQGNELAQSVHPVQTKGRDLPAFSWTYSIVDGGVEGTRGDQDGVAEQGELVGLQVHVQNVGSGPSTEAFVKVKNRAGKALDLKTGAVELDPLAPGESADALILFQVGLSGPELDVQVEVGDSAAYNHSVVWRAGFQETYAQREDLVIPVASAPQFSPRTPPTLEISRAPGLSEQQAAVVLSGVAKDDVAVDEVIVYHLTEDATDKIFYQGGQEGIQALPWTVDAQLEPGQNLFVVLTRDDQGLVATRSASVWYDATAVSAN